MKLIQTAGKEIITDLLDVLDDSERLNKKWLETSTDTKEIKQGVSLVFNKLHVIRLQSKGLKAMETVKN